jgi:TRAP-type mannitol/chloroaromatic compound transport system substrate-binding protein
MKRRQFIRGAGAVGTVAAAAAMSSLPKPAIAQSMPEVKWRLASSFPKSLDTLYGGAEYMAKRVAAMTDNKFQISVYAAGQLVPALQVLDAAQQGSIELAHSASYYYVGKDPTFAFATAMPFGLNTRQQIAWFTHGDAQTLMDEFYKEYNVKSFVAGQTGAQMGGFFRKEIKSVADLKGVKMRIGGWGGQVIGRTGVVAQQLAGGDIYPALEKGTIDAAEWVGPYDDYKLGFHKVAKFYYYPGWWEGCAMLTCFANMGAWEKLPKTYQEVLISAGWDTNSWMMSKYDADNPASLRKLLAEGTQLRAFPRDVMEASFTAAQDLYKETAAKNAKFKKVLDSWSQFRKEEYLWFQIPEYAFDSFMISHQKNFM